MCIFLSPCSREGRRLEAILTAERREGHAAEMRRGPSGPWARATGPGLARRPRARVAPRSREASGPARGAIRPLREVLAALGRSTSASNAITARQGDEPNWRPAEDAVEAQPRKRGPGDRNRRTRSAERRRVLTQQGARRSADEGRKLCALVCAWRDDKAPFGAPSPPTFLWGKDSPNPCWWGRMESCKPAARCGPQPKRDQARAPENAPREQRSIAR